MKEGAYAAMHTASLRDPDAFWSKAAEAVDWVEAPKTVLDRQAKPTARWFVDGRLNTCWNALDRHVRAGRGKQAAVIYESPVTGSSAVISYEDLLARVAAFAGALRERGVVAGDRVLVYMPMVPEALVAMLTCARLGAIHCTVFGGFAAHELAVRIDDCTPKVVVAASCGIEPKGVIAYMPIVDAALEISRHKAIEVVVLQRAQHPAQLKRGRDVDWNDAVRDAVPADCVPVKSTDPLYILYTSGTTGQPKGVVRDNGGHAVALLWSLPNLFAIKPGETFWSASDIGWQVGHTYTLYAPLLAGCTTVVFEGKPVGTPDAGAFWRVVERHKVAILLTAPTAIRAIRRDDPDGEMMQGVNLSSLRALFLAGERSDPSTLEWAESRLGVRVVDHWWQTESGWPIAGNPLGIEVAAQRHGSVALPLAGWDVVALRADGSPADRDEQGAIAIRLPLPPGALLGLWGAEDRFVTTYLTEFPGYYSSGDAGFVDPAGHIWIMARIDDVINVAGHRIATGALEEIVGSHADVAECAVFGVEDRLKGQVPLGLLVLKAGATTAPEAVSAEVVRLVARRMGPIACFRQAAVVDRLPKTRSGKVLRALLQKIANDEPFDNPATIEDATVVPEVAGALRTIGYAAKSMGL